MICRLGLPLYVSNEVPWCSWAELVADERCRRFGGKSFEAGNGSHRFGATRRYPSFQRLHMWHVIHLSRHNIRTNEYVVAKEKEESWQRDFASRGVPWKLWVITPGHRQSM